MEDMELVRNVANWLIIFIAFCLSLILFYIIYFLFKLNLDIKKMNKESLIANDPLYQDSLKEVDELVKKNLGREE